MRPITVSVGPLVAASANAIATSQTLAAAGALTLNGATASGGVATLDAPRRVSITSAGNDSGITFTITGADRSGTTRSETIGGGNAAAVSSALDYATVSSITTSGATASSVQAGTNATASSAWARMDEYASAPLGGQVSISGAATWSIDGTFDDPNSQTNPVAPALMNWQQLQDASEGQMISVPTSPLFVRLTLTAGAGSARATFVQYAELTNVGP